MPAPKKVEKLKNLAQKLKEADSVVLLNYQGLTHKQLSDLRKKLKEVGSLLSVTKNTLLRLALKSSHLKLPAPSDALTGPTAALFIPADPIPPLKILKEFQDEFDLPKIKIGIFKGELFSKEKVLKLATLPKKDVLTSQLVLALKSPTQRLALSLAWNLQKLTRILKSIRQSKD